MITVEVLTPRKIEYQQEAESITLPTLMGEISVLPKHASLISVLKPGKITIKEKDRDFSFEIEGGILEVSHDKATILLKDFHNFAKQSYKSPDAVGESQISK